VYVLLQKEAAKLRGEKDADAAAIADLREQVEEFKLNLEEVTRAKLVSEEEVSELRRILEQYQSENSDLRARAEMQAAEISSHTDRSAIIKSTLKDMEEFNKTSAELVKENADLQWQNTKCAHAPHLLIILAMPCRLSDCDKVCRVHLVIRCCLCRLKEELKVSQRATMSASASHGQDQAAQLIETLQQEHESLTAQNDMLNTEVRTLRMHLSDLQLGLQKSKDEHQHELERAHEAFRASEYHRLEDQRRSQDAGRLERERWVKEKCNLQV
jgi:regulator of replication initiation timing